MLIPPVSAKLFIEYEQKDTIYFAERDLKTLVVSAYLSSYLFVWKTKDQEVEGNGTVKESKNPRSTKQQNKIK